MNEPLPRESPVVVPQRQGSWPVFVSRENYDRLFGSGIMPTWRVFLP
jgi:hypothetical protein